MLDRRCRVVGVVASVVIVSVCAPACSRSAEPTVEASAQNDPVSPNIVWIVADQTTAASSARIDSLVNGGVRFTDTRSFGTSASARSALLTGMHPTAIGVRDDRLSGPPPAGVTVLPEQLRRAGYFTSRSGPALHNLSLGSFDSNRAQETAEQYQPGLLGAWDTAGRYVDWRGRDLDWDLPCTVAFGCDRRVSAGSRPFFSMFNVEASDQTSLGRDVSNILAALETDGLANNTAVFFLGLHTTDLELVVRWPQRLQAGTTYADPVSVVDLAPTALALAGVAGLPTHAGPRVVRFLSSGTTHTRRPRLEVG